MGSLRTLASQSSQRPFRSGLPINYINWSLVSDDPGFGEIRTWLNDVEGFADSLSVKLTVLSSRWRNWGRLLFRVRKSKIEVQCSECNYVSDTVFVRPDTKEITCVHCLNPYWGRM